MQWEATTLGRQYTQKEYMSRADPILFQSLIEYRVIITLQTLFYKSVPGFPTVYLSSTNLY